MDITTLGRRYQTLLQVFWTGSQHRGQDPFGNVQRCPNQTGSLGELLVDDELFEGTRIDAPWCRPVRRQQARVGEQRTLRSGSLVLVVAVRGGLVVTQLHRGIKRLGDPRPEFGFRVAEIHRHVARLGARELAQPSRPAIRRPDRSRQADGPAPVQVHVVFPGKADGAEHRQGVEHQVRDRRDRDRRGAGRR